MTTMKIWNGTDWEYVGFPNNVGMSPQTLAYAEMPAQQAGATTTEHTISSLVATVTVPEGRRIRISAQVIAINQSGAVNKAEIRFKEGSTNVGGFAEQGMTASGNGAAESIVTSVVITPTAGTHTYQLWGRFASGATNIWYTDPSNGQRSYLLVEDITGSTLPYQPASVPVGQLGYAALTANQLSITSEVAITGLSVNVAVPAGRVIRLSFRARVESSVAADQIRVDIKEDGVTRNYLRFTANTANRGYDIGDDVIISPTEGAHTYTATIQRDAGSGLVAITAASNFPTFLLVEDITPTPAPSSGAPGSTLGYAEKTTIQAGISTTTDLTGLSVTVTVPAGRRLRIKGRTRIQQSATTNRSLLAIYEGATELAVSTHVAGSTLIVSIPDVEVVVSPTPGTHTYKLAAGSNTGTVDQWAASTHPAYILVEDITGSVWPEGSEVTAGMVASEAWTSWTPTLTNLTLGNGTLVAKYTKIGRTVHFRLKITLGSTSAVATGPNFTLPVPMNADHVGNDAIHVTAQYRDNTGAMWVGLPLVNTSTTLYLLFLNGSMNYQNVSATGPFTWATSDAIIVNGTYEAAS